jgi:hypothetical protein
LGSVNVPEIQGTFGKVELNVQELVGGFMAEER